MRSFVRATWPNKNQRKPQIGPHPADFKDRIPAADPSKKGSDDSKGKEDQHDRNKQNKSIHAINPLKEFYNGIHQFLFLYLSSSPGQLQVHSVSRSITVTTSV